MDSEINNRLPENGIWRGAINRCYNKKCDKYRYYGGRGIKVCERWINSFENFLEDLGRRPSSKHWIERKNPDGDYEPENCCWSTISDQQQNRRNFANSVSKYQGVILKYNLDKSPKWRTRIQRKKIRIYVGEYYCENDAGYAYNCAAKTLFGETAKLNTIKEEIDELKKIYIEQNVARRINEHFQKINKN